jgi:hypothetical protein
MRSGRRSITRSLSQAQPAAFMWRGNFWKKFNPQAADQIIESLFNSDKLFYAFIFRRIADHEKMVGFCFHGNRR